MDNIFQKKSEVGRTRTRSDQETTAPSTAASRRNSRLSMLSSTSLSSSTPKIHQKSKYKNIKKLSRF